ncbi:Molybdopterin biosynthesis protein MoeA [Candidatus Paraburkholderia calva]|nr:Molybdopterin biosynthesis protein MoeA [Candidatus Paraburkholderia calva]
MSAGSRPELGRRPSRYNVCLLLSLILRASRTKPLRPSTPAATSRPPMLATAEALGILLDAVCPSTNASIRSTPRTACSPKPSCRRLTSRRCTPVRWTATRSAPPISPTRAKTRPSSCRCCSAFRRVTQPNRSPKARPRASFFTGATVPPGADTVVMQEMASAAGDAGVSFAQPPAPGE